MAYTTKTANSFTDILNHVRSFASTYCGFTDLGTETISGYETHKMSKGVLFYSFRIRTHSGTTVREIETKLTYIEPTSLTGWSTTGSTPSGQYGNGSIGTFYIDAPYTGLFLFTDETLAVHCVLEIASGLFTHFSFGSIEKTGAFDGGEYLMTQNILYYALDHFDYQNQNSNIFFFPDNIGSAQMKHNNVMKVRTYGNSNSYDFAQFVTERWGLEAFGTTYPLANYNSNLHLNIRLNFSAKCPYNFRSLLVPITIRMKDPDGSNQFFAGNVKDIMDVNLIYLQSKEIVDTDWQVFPRSARTGYDKTVGAVSGNQGLAYKRTGSAV